MSERRMLIDPLVLDQGLTTIIGESREGRLALCTAVAATVSSGIPWEGKVPKSQAKGPLIVIEELRRVIRDPTNEKHVLAAMDKIRDTIEETGATYLVAHDRWHGGTTPRGSAVVIGLSDIVIEVVAFEPEAGFIKLKHIKRSDGPCEEFGYRVVVKTVGGKAVPVVMGERLVPAEES